MNSPRAWKVSLLLAAILAAAAISPPGVFRLFAFAVGPGLALALCLRSRWSLTEWPAVGVAFSLWWWSLAVLIAPNGSQGWAVWLPCGFALMCALVQWRAGLRVSFGAESRDFAAILGLAAILVPTALVLSRNGLVHLDGQYVYAARSWFARDSFYLIAFAQAAIERHAALVENPFLAGTPCLYPTLMHRALGLLCEHGGTLAAVGIPRLCWLFLPLNGALLVHAWARRAGMRRLRDAVGAALLGALAILLMRLDLYIYPTTNAFAFSALLLIPWLTGPRPGLASRPATALAIALLFALLYSHYITFIGAVALAMCDAWAAGLRRQVPQVVSKRFWTLGIRGGPLFRRGASPWAPKSNPDDRQQDVRAPTERRPYGSNPYGWRRSLALAAPAIASALLFLWMQRATHPGPIANPWRLGYLLATFKAIPPEALGWVAPPLLLALVVLLARRPVRALGYSALALGAISYAYYFRAAVALDAGDRTFISFNADRFIYLGVILSFPVILRLGGKLRLLMCLGILLCSFLVWGRFTLSSRSLVLEPPLVVAEAGLRDFEAIRARTPVDARFIGMTPDYALPTFTGRALAPWQAANLFAREAIPEAEFRAQYKAAERFRGDATPTERLEIMQERGWTHALIPLDGATGEAARAKLAAMLPVEECEGVWIGETVGVVER